MGSEIGADVPLDYLTFQILPENRYGASICSEEKEEMVKDGPLELLLEHLPSIKDQIIQGSSDNFKLELPNSIADRKWFTKSTCMRFLHIIGSCTALNKCIAISNEMSQLEDTRKFHLSLYTQPDKIAASDNSKSELLQAMDSRIAALTEELLSTFNLAAGAAFSFQEMIDLREFCQHFGDVDIRNLLMKLSEKSQKSQTIVPVNKKKSPIPLVSKSDYVNKISGTIQKSRESNSLTPVQYDASPAKAAEIERQSSTDSDKSSYSSEDEQPPAAERSRTLIRSASPRSASPMRKVQIGRSGSRRTPALTIRSLPYFPARERNSSCRDPGYDFKPEGFEETNRKPEINVTRISVQDAISLFESRQNDKTVESQKKAGVENSTNTDKAVFRRWSSGISESQNSMTPDTVEPTVSQNNADGNAQKSAEIKHDGISAFENQKFEETLKTDMGLEGSKYIAMSVGEDDETVNQTDEASEKLDSAEWTRQKEEELNKMLMKFAEYNLSNIKNTDPDNKKTKRVSRTGKSGTLNGNPKEKRDEKITGEKSLKRVEKQSGIRAKQRVPDKSKPEKSSLQVNDTVKKLPASRTSTVNKSGPISTTAKKESLKPAVPKKAPSKTSALPVPRKSWPSTPSPRVTGALTTRSPIITPPSVTSAPCKKSQSSVPRQKPHSPGPVSRPSPKLEKPQVQQKDVKKQQLESKKSTKKVDENKSLVVPKNGKTTKIKMVTAPKEDAPAALSPAKGVLRKKVTKKSSVVPLEVKPSVRKVLEKSPASQKKDFVPPQVEETLSKSEDTQNAVDNLGTITSDKIDLVEAQDSDTQNDRHVELEIESETKKPEIGIGNEAFVEAPQVDEVGERMMDSLAKIQIQIQPAHESVISPAAWVESDQQDTAIVPPSNNSSLSLANPDIVTSSEMRVRYSLSQMLLEESSEPDIIEWGNAEHPPSMVYQKDAPKGLKRLLKFARKNKEANGASWASPYTSEGEDDGDEYRNLGKGKSDNLLKVALHSKNYAEGFLSDNEPLSARSNASNSSARSSNKFQDGHGSSKGARSFFSLSAFRGKN